MASGFDKYFQIAPCFRDEDARGDRSPGEFYQLDMEMAFASQEDVFAVLEDVLPPIFAKYGTYTAASAPFRRIPYPEAMETYGSDKPDLRIDLTVRTPPRSSPAAASAPLRATGSRPWWSPASRDPQADRQALRRCGGGLRRQALLVPPGRERRDRGRHRQVRPAHQGRAGGGRPGPEAGLTSWASPPASWLPPRRPPASWSRPWAPPCPDHMDKEQYEFCWIVDFPMYEIGEESGELEFCHNPFSMPSGGLEVLKRPSGARSTPDHHRRPVRPGVQRRGAVLRRGAEPRPGDHDQGL